jgi:hypothetical protein
MSRHYPPAYFKYRKTHATISISVTKEFKEELNKRRGHLSYSNFLKKLMSDFDSQVNRRIYETEEKIREDVRNNEDNFRVPCWYCGKFIYLSGRQLSWPKTKKVLYEAFKEWYHIECLNKAKKEAEDRSK